MLARDSGVDHKVEDEARIELARDSFAESCLIPIDFSSVDPLG